MRLFRNFSFVILIGCMISFGCRAKPAPDAGFLSDPKLMKNDVTVPFNRVWFNPDYHDKAFTQIYVAPVNTNYVMKENIWEMASFANLNPDYVAKNLQLMAAYQQQAVIDAIKKDPNKKFTVVDKPGPGVLVYEMAIVQLVPSKPLLQATSYYTWISTLVMIGGSAATNSEDQGKGVVAMEARTRDGANGPVTCMFADREHPPTAIIDVKALFWWESAKPICDGWARQFVQMEGNPKGKHIDEISNFQWLVW